MNKKEIAAAITANWETSRASTISKRDVKELSENAPGFGVLDEKSGRKIYAFLENGVIKKLVIPLYSGILQDEANVVSLIEKDFTLRQLHRMRK